MLRKAAQANGSRRDDGRGTFRDFLILDDCQPAIDFFLLGAQCCGGGNHCRCRQETAAGIVHMLRRYALPCFLRRKRSGFGRMLVGDSPFVAFADAIHAGYASAVINPMVWDINASRLAIADTEVAIDTFIRVDDRLEPGVTGKKPQDGAHGTNRIAICPAIPPCQHCQHDEGQYGNDKGW